MMRRRSLRVLVLAWVLSPATAALAQGTAADYERANGLRARYESLVANIAGPATWIDNTHRFWQVVNQLIKHNKDFDLLYIPGAGHGAGGAYGEHKRFDFFVRYLLGAHPPEWTDKERATQ